MDEPDPPAIEFLISHPVLPSLDLDQTVTFYEAKLGFARTLLSDEVAVLKRDRIELHFWKCNDANIPANSSCRIQVTGIETLRNHCQSMGITAGEMQGSEHYRVFPINDLDGNLIWFFELHGPPPWERQTAAS